MPISFPASPSLNQLYVYSGRTWIWNGTYWQSVGTVQGVNGAQGPQGTSGTSQGTTGNQGTQGIQGNTGLQGLSGTSQGTQGIQGAAGTAFAASFNAQTVSYQLVAGDLNKIVTMNVGTANNLTVPANVFSAGNIVYVQQIGTGQTTIVASGVTITSTPGLKLRAQFSMAAIICTSSNNFTVTGDLSA